MADDSGQALSVTRSARLLGRGGTAALLGLVAAGALAGASAAGAATLTVNDDNAGPGPVGANCETAPFATVQAAINAANPNDTIQICAGTYVEQPVVDRTVSLIGAGDETVIQSPASVNVVTRYLIPGFSIQPVVHVDADNVVIRDLVVDGNRQGNVNGNFLFVGIGALDQTGLEVHDSLVTKIQKTPFDGVQTGFGIRVDNTDLALRTVLIEGNRLTQYQKGGIVVRGLGLDGTVRDNIIRGVGEQTDIAQNGISFGRGMSGVIEGNEVSDNLCAQATCGPDVTIQTQSAGLTMFAAPAPAGGDVLIEDNLFENNDSGIFSRISDGSLRTVRNNSFVDNRYVGLYTDDGEMEASGNAFTGGDHGVVALSGSGNLAADLHLIGNTVVANDLGVRMIQIGANPPPVVQADHNRIVGNATAGASSDATTPTDMENNWWGCNEGPGQPGCDDALGNIDFDPWLVLSIDADPEDPQAGTPSQITARLTTNSDDQSVGTGFPDGVPVAFGTDFGTLDPPSSTTEDAIAETVLSSDDPGQATVTATLDNETVQTGLIVFGTPTPPPGHCSNIVRGTSGPDDLIGTNGSDLILGLGGIDVLRGLRGDDCLRGHGDNDRIIGGIGGDHLAGRSGEDRLIGGSGRDTVNAGSGDDHISADDGHVDAVRCGAGHDVVIADGRDPLDRCEIIRRR